MKLNVRERLRTMRMNNRGERGGEGKLNVREEPRTMRMNEGEGVRAKGMSWCRSVSKVVVVILDGCTREERYNLGLVYY